MKASYYKYILNFKQASGTSRGVLNEKETWFIQLESDGKKGLGECGILRGLSCDDRPDYRKAGDRPGDRTRRSPRCNR